MKTQHTPGPWRTTTIGTIEANEIVIAECVDSNNRDIIAAAPELLEALQDVLNQLKAIGIIEETADSGNGWADTAGLCFKQANAAIAKATGTT